MSDREKLGVVGFVLFLVLCMCFLKAHLKLLFSVFRVVVDCVLGKKLGNCLLFLFFIYFCLFVLFFSFGSFLGLTGDFSVGTVRVGDLIHAKCEW